jgi:large subunit ribosomal protein L6
MKHPLTEKIEIPEGVSCVYEDGMLKCRKGDLENSRKMNLLQTEIRVGNNEIVLHCERGSKNQHKILRSAVAHIKNLFSGLNEKFVYKLETCNVHFPMSLKLEKNELIVNNFLGEKVPRKAKILPGVEVELKGAKITVTSNDRESAGQTAANFEKATKLRGRDKRIFQDGIFIVEKPGRFK